ncbi:5-carboxymethyl-2-hydroxymuconate isomerase [Aquabacterium sp.]|uniref:5-carboxymethyl-2-hydroxymuconate isomerase n=1 Tax=Aquabacterium sp. TaxID=1872578 RepID=UPI002CE1223F|nr:5-carboxymethyl-2-hydroxymuconate isomerase [Aquabacterium sp.]HSW07334.1 5-carboxymethyl-2-hydroxymuconate isomerase [Aquabacterium sp.]
MPHVVVLYTADLDQDRDQDPAADMSGLCRRLADAMLGVRDEGGAPVFPTGGVRVFAYPAAHSAVADGSGDHGFVYIQLRMGRGRSPAVHQRTGEALSEAVRCHCAPLLARRHLGLTLQIDEGAEVFDAKLGNLHPLFTPAR